MCISLLRKRAKKKKNREKTRAKKFRQIIDYDRLYLRMIIDMNNIITVKRNELRTPNTTYSHASKAVRNCIAIIDGDCRNKSALKDKQTIE